MKWVCRFFLLWMMWLFVTSYIQVSRQTHAHAFPADGKLACVPPANTGLDRVHSVTISSEQELNLANSAHTIYQQAMAAKARAEKEKSLLKNGDNTTGLEGIELDLGAPEANLGCDPSLAFKVPQQ